MRNYVDLPEHDEPKLMATNPILYWNKVGLDMNRLSTTLSSENGGGRQGGPTMASRALGILHLSIHDAYFSIDRTDGTPTYLDSFGAPGALPDEHLPELPAVPDTDDAVSGAAYAALKELYVSVPGDRYDAVLREALVHATFLTSETSESFKYGEQVAAKIVAYLAVLDGESGASSQNALTGKRYEYQLDRGKFRREPTHALEVSLPTGDDPHGPFYGEQSRLFAVQNEASHRIAAPPTLDLNPARSSSTPDPACYPDPADYVDAVRVVRRLGGAPNLLSTARTPDQTTAAYYWAYDGAKLIGTPPRLYNQIVRRIAWAKKTGDAAVDTRQFARLFALVNAAMGDAGVFAWHEKYRYNFWRPLSAVREHGPGTGVGASDGAPSVGEIGDPFWLSLGAPDTNSNRRSFKPPFPAYPSGHATFGAAALQIVRLFYKERDHLTFDSDKVDDIAFDFVSDELDGRSRDLYQPLVVDQPIESQDGNVRTRIVRHFKSCWHAIFENGASRVYLGVHFVFDAFASKDVHGAVSADGSTVFKDPSKIRYKTNGDDDGTARPIGGVPLGLGIANDIFVSGLKRPPVQDQRPRAGGGPETTTKVLFANTNIR